LGLGLRVEVSILVQLRVRLGVYKFCVLRIRKRKSFYIPLDNNRLRKNVRKLAIEKKISMDANNPKDLMKLEVNMPRNVVGDICDLVAKSFKLAVALKDDAIRFKMLGILGDLINILIWIRFYLYRGEKVDVDTIKNELADLKKELERIVKYYVSP